MNIDKARIGLLFSPTTPLCTYTVDSYNSTTFELTVSGKVGASTGLIGLAIEAAGYLLRIKDVDTAGADAIFSLAPNGLTGAVGTPLGAGETVYIYNVRRPFPKFQLVALNTIDELTGDAGGDLSGWVVNGTDTNNTDGSVLYWQTTFSGAAIKVSLYWDAAMTDGLVAATVGYAAIPATVSFTERNDSGISGSVVVGAGAGADNGSIRVGGAVIYQDWDITYNSLGASDDARSHADQKPVGIVEPAALWADVNEVIPFDSSESYATYYGYPGGGPRRRGTVADPGGHAWDAGTDGVVGGAGSAVNVHWTSAGFRYLKYTVTDTVPTLAGVSQVRYIPSWIGITPETKVTRCMATWRKNNGCQVDITYQYTTPIPESRLMYSQCAVVDLETDEVLFIGFVWPESVRYNFERGEASFTILSDLAYLNNIPGDSMRLQGQEGSPTQWWLGYSPSLGSNVAGNFDWLNVWRGALWMIRNHSNYLELANVRMPTDPLEPTAISDDRKEYIRDYTAGTLLQQLVKWGDSFRFVLYGRRLGGFDALLDPLYSATITSAADDALTQDLTDAQMLVSVDYQKPVHQMDELRASGFYHTGDPSAGFSFDPIIIRSPSKPDVYGNVNELSELLATANTTSKGTYTGYQEMLIWAGRHIGLANTSYRYTLKPSLDIEIPLLMFVDFPDTPGALTQTRIAIEEQRWNFVAQSLRWDFDVVGRTFGTTYDAAIEPVPTAPGTPVSPTDPLPTPITNYGDGNVVAWAATETSTGDIKIYYTGDFLDASPTWTDITGDFPQTGGNTERPWCITFAQGGTNPRGIYLTTYDDSTSPDTGWAYYCADPTLASWTALTPPVGCLFGGTLTPSLIRYAFCDASPLMDGDVLINTLYDDANDDQKVAAIYNDGVLTNQTWVGRMRNNSSSQIIWDTDGELVSGHDPTGALGDCYLVKMPKTAGLGVGGAIAGYYVCPLAGGDFPEWFDGSPALQSLWDEFYFWINDDPGGDTVYKNPDPICSVAASDTTIPCTYSTTPGQRSLNRQFAVQSPRTDLTINTTTGGKWVVYSDPTDLTTLRFTKNSFGSASTVANPAPVNPGTRVLTPGMFVDDDSGYGMIIFDRFNSATKVGYIYAYDLYALSWVNKTGNLTGVFPQVYIDAGCSFPIAGTLQPPRIITVFHGLETT